MPNRLLFLSLLSAVILVPSVHAHDTWLAPDRFRNAPGSRGTLYLSSGMEFPKLDHAIARDRVASATWNGGRDRGALQVVRSAEHALEFRGGAARGITVYSVVLHPRPSKLKREQVREYIDHLGIPNADDVFAAWKQSRKADETGYRYMKYAKTFVRRGEANPTRVWAESAGMRLELIPQNDPTSLRAGSTLDVVLVDRGKPLQRHPVTLLREGAEDPVSAVTDGEGRVRHALPAPGRYMLRATTLEPSADKSAAWDVHFTTMTFQAD